MDVESKKIYEIVRISIEELNKQLPHEKRISTDENTTIVGSDSLLDSLGMVTLFVIIETHISKHGIDCNLLDELIADYDVHPFTTIGSLVKWIEGGVKNGK